MRKLSDSVRQVLGFSGGLSNVEPGLNAERDYAEEAFARRCKATACDKDYLMAQAKIGRQTIESVRVICDSPIEKLIVPWLVYQDYGLPWPEKPRAALFCPSSEGVKESNEGDIYVCPQADFGAYRLDFLICANIGGRHRLVAVECDGKEFHSTDSDFVRDSIFKSVDIPTVRLTGSQIHQSPQAAALKVAHVVCDGPNGRGWL